MARGADDLEDVASRPAGRGRRERWGAAREPLLNCYAVLHDMARTAPDAQLRDEVARYLGEVATVLRTISGEDA